ncbi:MAG TPA: hypothetical protein HPP83_13215 [Candidatus Hydrogenedentes bacterium]|nr:hypothetical protein [Candidatus Hydrogenedentota bacterium]
MKRRWLRVAPAAGGLCAVCVIALFIVPRVFDGMPRLIEGIFEVLDPVIPRRFRPVTVPVVEDPRVVHAQEPHAEAGGLFCESVLFTGDNGKVMVLGYLDMKSESHRYWRLPHLLSRPFVATYDLASGAFRELVTHWPAGAYGETCLWHIRTTDMNVYFGLGSDNDYLVYGDEKGVEHLQDAERTERRYRRGAGRRAPPFRRRYYYRMPINGGALSPWKPLAEFARGRLAQEYDCVIPVYECYDEGYVVAQCWQERDLSKEYVLYDVVLETIIGRVVQSAREAGISIRPFERFGDHRQFLAVTETHGEPSSSSRFVIRIFQLSPVFSEVGVIPLPLRAFPFPPILMCEVAPNELLVMGHIFCLAGLPDEEGHMPMCEIPNAVFTCVPGPRGPTLEVKGTIYWLTPATDVYYPSDFWPLVFRDGLLYLMEYRSTDDGSFYPFLFVEPYPERPEPDAFTLPGPCLGINTDGSLVATAQPSGFRIWSIDFPDIHEVASCRLAYDPESQGVVVADVQEAAGETASHEPLYRWLYDPDLAVR